MEKILKILVLTLGTVMCMGGILAFVFQVQPIVALTIAGLFFLLHKVMVFQETILARWKLESLLETDDPASYNKDKK